MIKPTYEQWNANVCAHIKVTMSMQIPSLFQKKSPNNGCKACKGGTEISL